MTPRFNVAIFLVLSVPPHWCTNTTIEIGQDFTDLMFSANVSFVNPDRENEHAMPVTFSDVDGDGFVDVAFLLNENPSMVAWRRNVDGTGSFAVVTNDTGTGGAGSYADQFEYGENILLDTTNIQDYGGHSHVVFANFTGTSRDDLLVANNPTTWYSVGNGIGNYSAERGLGTEEYESEVRALVAL